MLTSKQWINMHESETCMELGPAAGAAFGNPTSPRHSGFGFGQSKRCI